MLWIAGEDMVIFILTRSLRGAVAKKVQWLFWYKKENDYAICTKKEN